MGISAVLLKQLDMPLEVRYPKNCLETLIAVGTSRGCQPFFLLASNFFNHITSRSAFARLSRLTQSDSKTTRACLRNRGAVMAYKGAVFSSRNFPQNDRSHHSQTFSRASVAIVLAVYKEHFPSRLHRSLARRFTTVQKRRTGELM